jgi:hypothetical protein
MSSLCGFFTLSFGTFITYLCQAITQQTGQPCEVLSSPGWAVTGGKANRAGRKKPNPSEETINEPYPAPLIAARKQIKLK